MISAGKVNLQLEITVRWGPAVHDNGENDESELNSAPDEIDCAPVLRKPAEIFRYMQKFTVALVKFTPPPVLHVFSGSQKEAKIVKLTVQMNFQACEEPETAIFTVNGAELS